MSSGKFSSQSLVLHDQQSHLSVGFSDDVLFFNGVDIDIDLSFQNVWLDDWGWSGLDDSGCESKVQFVCLFFWTLSSDLADTVEFLTGVSDDGLNGVVVIESFSYVFSLVVLVDNGCSSGSWLNNGGGSWLDDGGGSGCWLDGSNWSGDILVDSLSGISGLVVRINDCGSCGWLNSCNRSGHVFVDSLSGVSGLIIWINDSGGSGGWLNNSGGGSWLRNSGGWLDSGNWS